jgi:hypothetical protein
MLKVFARISATLVVLAWGVLAWATSVQAQLSLTIPAVDVAAALQKTLGDTAIHLHNHGPFKDGSYYAANASSIKVPTKVTGIPGQRTRFSVPEEQREFLGRRYAYYIDHVRSTGFFVTSSDDTFTFSITLASPGPALIGTCVRLRAPAAPCANLSEQNLPSVEWRDARIDIVLKPIVENRGVTMDVQSVTIGGVFDVGKACEFPLFGTRLCAALNRLSDRLRARVATQVKTILNSDDVRREVAAGVRQYLDTTVNEPLLGVRRISMQNGTLTLALGLSR